MLPPPFVPWQPFEEKALVVMVIVDDEQYIAPPIPLLPSFKAKSNEKVEFLILVVPKRVDTHPPRSFTMFFVHTEFVKIMVARVLVIAPPSVTAKFSVNVELLRLIMAVFDTTKIPPPRLAIFFCIKLLLITNELTVTIYIAPPSEKTPFLTHCVSDKIIEPVTAT